MLNSILVSKARISILKALLLYPDGRFYLRELAQKTGLPLRSVQVELKRLTTAGILDCETSGKQTYYQVNERCPIIPELRSIFIKTVGVADVIREALLPEVGSISAAFIYGSFARGDIRAESDIDLFVVGEVTLRRLVTLLRDVDIARVINPTVITVDEFQAKLHAKDHFINSLMGTLKVFLFGNADDLIELAA